VRKSKSYKIAVIPGDGTGPEVIAEGIKVIKSIGPSESINFEFVYYDLGGERYKKTGEILPDSVLEEIKKTDAIYLGAIGHPEIKPGILEKGILLRMRFELDQYINLRPVKLYPHVPCPLKDKGPQDIDFVVVRENTEGLYTGGGGFLKKGTPDEVAIQESINTRKGVERCLRYAYQYTEKRNKTKKLTLCGKTNVLTYAFDLWERTFFELAKEFPKIKTDYANVDATCMWMVKNPEWFDVIVTDNMFGDIITDLGAIIQGGMGIARGAISILKACPCSSPLAGQHRNTPGKCHQPFGSHLCWGHDVGNIGRRTSREKGGSRGRKTAEKRKTEKSGCRQNGFLHQRDRRLDSLECLMQQYNVGRCYL